MLEIILIILIIVLLSLELWWIAIFIPVLYFFI